VSDRNDGTNFVPIYQTDSDQPRVWLMDCLEDEGIPYKVLDDAYWTGHQTPQYHAQRVFYVPPAYESRVQALIDDYNNPDNFVAEDDDETLTATADNLPQITCPLCGETYDFDYPTCPRCADRERAKRNTSRM
jgi:hypothetical protein